MTTDNPDFDESAEIRSEDSHEFDPPKNGEGEGEADASDSDFDPPSLNAEGAGDEADASSSVVRQAKEEIERRLAEAASQSSMSVAEMRRVDDPGVVGVGQSMGGFPGRESLVVFVESDAGQEAVRREVTDTLGVRAATDDELPIEIVVTGPIEPLTNRLRFRPAPAGASVGHHAITAGTIGGWARGNGDRGRRLLMVSNNHVLANSNRGRFGDAILQPGTADRGRNPADRIAILERFISITFGGSPNYVDAATGWCWPNLVRRDHVYHAGAAAKFFRIGRSVVEPRVDMIVGKTGRTTDLTRGIVTATGVSINVNFGAAGVAHFRDQFAVRSLTSGTFSAGGDSGSFVWQWNRRLSPVGLLFAGGGGTTFCNRMSRVLAALQVSPL